MFRRVWLVAPLLLLCACEEQICALLGAFEGAFSGDLEGSLEALVSEDPDSGAADVHLTLTSATGLFEGSAKVDCVDGDLILDLRDVEGTSVGTVTGQIEEGQGHGAYELLTGETGTWEY
ncbi:MAG: hypothetical protein R3F59_23715 [Myxococcota bacterium]